jgi:hypothetical protein
MAEDTKIKSWGEYKDAMLEGLDGRARKYTAQLMENVHGENAKTIGDAKEVNSIVTESTAVGSTVTSNISRYDMMFMPLVRRVTPALLAMDLVGVQPLPGPQGIVRTIRHRYSEATDEAGVPVVTAGDEASGMNVYDKYSLLARGDDYDAVDNLDPYAQTVYMEGNRGKSLDLEVVTDRVTPKSRKLSAAWSLETEDDLQALDGLDVESELTASLSDEILREKDRELIDNLTGLAGTVESFDFINVDGRYAGEKLAALLIQVDNLSAQIAMKTKLSGATWMVVGQRVFTAMKHASNSSFIPANNGELQISSSLFVGTFGAGVSVYVDPYADGDTILMGRKGSGDLDAGFFYLPYIPLQSSGAVRNPETGDHRVMLRTRYALYAATDSANSLGDAPDHYARMSVSNLALGFTN